MTGLNVGEKKKTEVRAEWSCQSEAEGGADGEAAALC